MPTASEKMGGEDSPPFVWSMFMAEPVYAALDFETADYQPDSACAIRVS